MDWLQAQWNRRPWWMNLMFLFCAYMTVIYLPWDIFVKAAESDQEVWFGYRFLGTAAKIAAVPHWIVYGLGAFGFYGMKKWMHPWASVYLGQVTIAFIVFPWLYGPGMPGNLIASIVSGLVWGGITWKMWSSAALFDGQEAGSS